MGQLKDVPPLLIEVINRLQAAEVLNRMGVAGERIIQKRTREGIDVEGRPFKPYSDAYAKKRDDNQLPVTPVTLSWDQYSGMMKKIESIVAADTKSVSLDITDEEKKKIMYYHSEKGVAKEGENIRKAWDLSDEEEKKIVKIAEQEADLILADLSAAFNAI